MKTRNYLRGVVGFAEELGKEIFPHIEAWDPQGLGGLKEGQALVSILKSLSQADLLAGAWSTPGICDPPAFT